MKRIHEEIRIIRQQMEEDFLLHRERIAAQTQSIERKRNLRVLDVLQSGAA